MSNEHKLWTENALITNADMVFDDIGGKNGRNFRLTLKLKTLSVFVHKVYYII